MKDADPDGSRSEASLVLATDLFKEWDKKKLDPVIAYAALGCAFQMLHQGLGKGKEEWLDTTKEMAEITWEKK